MTVETYAWFIKHHQDLDPDAYAVVLCDEAHTALGERTSASIRKFSKPTYIGMTATDQLLQKHVSDVFPAEIADFPLSDAVRRGVVAPLRCLRVRPGASLRNVPGRRRRLRPGPARRSARPRGAEHGGGRLLRRPLRRPRRDHLRRRRRPRRERRAGAARGRRQGEGGLRQDAAARARRDARGLRARRDERARQRAAARRGLERPARDDLHAPRADREPARLPAARRPRDAPAPPQGGRASSSTSPIPRRRTRTAR